MADSRNNKGQSTIEFIMTFSAAVGFIFLFLRMLGWITRHGEYLTVPAVVGQKTDDAIKLLEKQGFDVPKATIRMPEGPLKMIGDYPIKVALHADVVVSITVSVLGETA